MLHTPRMSPSMASMAPLDLPDVDEGEEPPITPPAEDYYYDEEPDEEWKENRRQIIEDSFQELIQEAKAGLERKLQSLRVMDDLDEEDRENERQFLLEEFQNEQKAMKALAKDEFEHALARERLLRRLRRDSPILRPTMNHTPSLSPTLNHQSLRLDLEQEQAATLKAATHDNASVEAAFQSLIHPTPDHDRTSFASPDADDDRDPIAELKENLKAQAQGKGGDPEVEHISPSMGALTIKITRLPAEPPANTNVGWVKASDAAKKHDAAVRQRANSRTEQIAGPPQPPPVKWVSASEAARRTTHRRIESSHGS
ncbi:hypothetical protein K438DRAFT_2011072 [Mycena galopus ATCC 62051]|nr:hypothetical protein K438DRAFT_2011072 [Mycena galopus ATCC 62051]